MNIVEQSAKILSLTSDAVLHIERCGRVCYKSEDALICNHNTTYEDGNPCPACLDRATTFVKGLIKRGHESVLEHAVATVLFVADRGLTHEIVRHRLASYSQESTRYCNYGKNNGINVILPSVFENSEYEAWYQAMEEAEKTYLWMISMGVQPQWARSVLPTCLKTEIVVTANFRQWRHMFGLRLGNKAGKAHPQIRELFKLALDQFLDCGVECIFEEYLDEKV